MSWRQFCGYIPTNNHKYKTDCADSKTDEDQDKARNEKREVSVDHCFFIYVLHFSFSAV